MPVDVEVRSRGIGGSEIAAILGLDPRKDAFAVYCDKLNLIERAAPNARMKWGKRIEKVIVEAYSEETKQLTEWCDQTASHRHRQWQVYTPDAFVYAGDRLLGGVDAKNVAWDQAPKWADGTIPEWVELQAHWYMSASELPWWDIAALFGGNDLRISRIHRDPDIESVLLEEGEKFWRNHIVARVAPPIGSSAAAAEYLRQRFPKNTETLRPATAEELPLLQQYGKVRREFESLKAEKDILENRIKLLIGDADGIEKWCTWRKNKDSEGVNYEKIAIEYLMTMPPEERAEVEKKYWDVLKQGPRVFLWKAK